MMYKKGEIHYFYNTLYLLKIIDIDSKKKLKNGSEQINEQKYDCIGTLGPCHIPPAALRGTERRRSCGKLPAPLLSAF